MKKIIYFLFILCLSTVTLANDKLGIGIGVGNSNSIYKGAKNEVYPIPLLDIDYGNFYIKGITPGYFFFKGDRLALSVFVNPIAGFPIKAKDIRNEYSNIDNRDFQAMIGLRADFNSGFAGIRTGALAQFGKHGAEVKVSAFRPFHITEEFSLVPGLHVRGFSDEYVDYYFGITSNEVNKSNKDSLTKEYKGETASSIGATLTADYKYSENFSLIGILAIEKFSNKITNSPIVKDKPLFITSLGVKYYF